MNDTIKDIQESCLFKCGFYHAGQIEGYNIEGTCYSIRPENGKGHYWVYSMEDLFSISIQDLVFYEDFCLEYQQPRYLGINYYDSVSKEEMKPYKRLTCNCIVGHTPDSEPHQVIYHKNIPIRSTGIEIMPEYCEEYLNTRYPGEFKNIWSAFTGIDGTTGFSEIVFLLRQIRSFGGTGVAAKIYYEGKVAEAVSLIIEKTKRKRAVPPGVSLSHQDMERLASVREYIDDYFVSEIHLEHLARIACMGTTKLKYSFKKAYECTITEYIHSKRMSLAEHLLANTDSSINQIAQAVGYSHIGRFSELFRRSTGMLPCQYRKLILCKSI